MSQTWVDPCCFEKMVTIRRDLHQHPELSWEENRTTDKICERLKELGISYSRSKPTGVVAEIPGSIKSPYIALRADIDALPIQEETGLSFSSTHAGVMHACAHDGHTSMLLGAAELLSKEKELPVPVRLIFQAAEEHGDGAKALMEAGVLEDVAMIFGGHLDRHYAPGSIIISSGPVNASTDTFDIEICGQGGHAARPHESIDAVVVGSLIVMSIQTIVSREINPAHPSVVSISTFHAGTASNVIAGQAKLSGTIRAQHPEVRKHLQQAIVRICNSIAQLHGAEIKTRIYEGTPPVINTLEMANYARRAAEKVVGEEGIGELYTANMGGEDFGHYLEEVSGCYVRFGSQVDGKEGYPAHSSKFDFDEEALAVGASYYYQLVQTVGKKIQEKELANKE